MKFCDVTIAYNEKSGGIRTYIDEKRRFLREHTNHQHLLIVPGEKDGVELEGASTIVQIGAPLLPNQDAYRFFLSPGQIKDTLAQFQPDVVELGSYYMEPWAAFSYRRRRREAGERCLIGGYFHTDVAEAYVASPLRAAAHAWLEDVSEALTQVADRIADIAAAGAESYIRYIFQHCDLAMAAAPAQTERLRDYGVTRPIEIVPMGVDLDLFDPRRRSQAVRAEHGAGPDTLVLAYAGRLSTEKRVFTLVEALQALPQSLHAQLWIAGDGPLRDELEAEARRNPNVRLLEFENDRIRFAELIASADVYVSAGPFETFGLSVIEAQASGLPVVGVDAGALRERVPEGLGYLVPVDDAAAMAETVQRAARERERLGAAARAHVEQHFSWDGAFRKWLACYEALWDSPPDDDDRPLRPRPAGDAAALGA